MSKFTQKLRLFTLGILWLTACVSTPTLVPMETQRPEESALLPSPPTPSPEMTASPTDTFLVTMQANQTQNAVYNLTQDAWQTEMALRPTETPRPISTPTISPYPETVFDPQFDIEDYEMIESPVAGNKNWVAFSNRWGFPEMIVSDGFGITLWKINYFNPDSSDGEGYFEAYIRPVYWTQDEKYLFFSIKPQFDGCPVLQDGERLQRLDLETGQVSSVLDSGRFDRFAFTFSPNGAWLASIHQSESPLRLALYRLRDGEEKTYPLNGKYGSAGSIFWSLDQTKIVITALEYNPETGCDPTYDLLQVNLEENNVRVLLEDTNALLPREWLTENEILIGNWESKFTLNLTTGELTPIE